MTMLLFLLCAYTPLLFETKKPPKNQNQKGSSQGIQQKAKTVLSLSHRRSNRKNIINVLNLIQRITFA